MDLKEIIDKKNENFQAVIRKFEEEILPPVKHRVNTGKFHLMSAKLITELLPTNERNLTDARTRIGTLLEYQFAVELNNILKENYTLEDYDVGFVLANQYPDLVIRNELHQVVLRIEMKSVQGISEEKSANFDALIRNVEQHTDALCIILWEWEKIEEKNADLEYPKISEIYFFDAYEIAKIRDYGWLKNGNRRSLNKLIDVSGPYVPVGENEFKEEEGNAGKILRIDSTDENNPEAVRFEKFKSEAQLFGIQQIVKKCIRIITDNKNDISIISNEYNNKEVQKIHHVTYQNMSFLFLAGNRRKKRKIKELSSVTLQESDLEKINVIIMNEKFDWTLYDYSKTESLIKIEDGNKPLALFTKMKDMVDEPSNDDMESNEKLASEIASLN